MKKVVLLAFAMASCGILMSQTVTSYPYTENFDTFPFDNTSFAPGSEPNPLVNDWVNDTTDVATQDWYGRSTATGSSNTGPSSDHTGGGRYMFVEDGFGNHNDIGLISPLFDLTTSTSPALSVWVHSRTTSTSANSLIVNIWTSSTNTWTQIDSMGALSTTDTWFEMTYNLSAYSSDSVRIAFVVDNSTTSFQHDIAIDDFSIFNTVFGASASTLSNNNCSNDANGSAAISWIFNSGPVSVSWSNGATADTITGLTDGTYTVTATDSAGSSVTDTITISSSIAAPVFSSSGVDASCSVAPDGTAQVDSVTSYSGAGWTPTCGDVSIVSVDTSSPTFATIDTGSITNSSTGYPAMFGNWYWGAKHQLMYRASELTAAGFGAGYFSSIQVPVTQINGTSTYLNYRLSMACTSDTTLDAGYVTGLSEVSFNDTLVIDTGLVQIDFHTPYYWDGTTNIVLEVCFNNTGFTNNSITPQTNVGYTAVRYYRADISTVCSNTTSSTGTSSNRPNLTFRQDLVAPYNPLTYAWNTGATTSSITGITPGNYTVTVSDGFCSATQTVTVGAGTVSVSTSVDSNATSCTSGGATATMTGGTAPFTYAWSSGGNTASTALPVGSHTVTVTDVNGCSETGNVTITGPAAAFASIPSSTNISCNGSSDGTALVSASGGTAPYTYLWSTGATTSMITGLSTGTYTATVSDNAGCISINTVSITEPLTLTSTVTVNSNVSCNGSNDGELTVAASGGTAPYSFAWSNGSTSANNIGLTAGTYTVTTTDANACTSIATGAITEPTNLIGFISSSSNPLCNGDTTGSATVTAAGGTGTYTYAWSNGATSNTISGLTVGSYTVTITDANGCTQTVSHSVTQPNPIVTSFFNTSDPSCNGNSDGTATIVSVGGTSPFTYTWSNGVTTATNTMLSSGVSSVTVTDANGCTKVDSVTLTEPAILVASLANSVDVLCFGDNSGSATAAVTGGTQPYSYSWSNGSTGLTANLLTGGTYTMTVTDANGCTDTTVATIVEPTSAVSATTIVTDALCSGSSDGSISVTASGGTSAYSYLWSNGTTTATNSGLTAGTYTVTVTDANGCTITLSDVVNEPFPINASLYLEDINCNGDSTGLATAIGGINGGTAPYTFNWSTGATADTLSGVPAGTYTLTITDANSCTGTSTITLDENTALDVQLGIDNVTCEGGNNGAISTNVSGGVPNYTYAWDNSATTSDIDTLVVGTYAVTVTDNLGCIQTASGTVDFDNVNPDVDLGPDVAIGPGSISLSSGFPSATNSWSTGESTETINPTVTSDTSFWVQVTTTEGCTGGDTIVVDVLLGTGDAANNSSIKLYPNPSNGMINVQVENFQADEIGIQVLDLSGKIVMERSWEHTSHLFNQQIDLSNQSQGVYFVNVIIDGHKHTERITIY